MSITRSIQTFLVFALMCVVVPPQKAVAQIWFGGGPARNPVLASKDFEEILDSVGFDDGQRQLAASMFDDAQIPMFAAKRRFDDEMDRIGTTSRDEKSLAAQQQARRALSQSILETTDGFFQSLAAVARPEQQANLDRQRLAGSRRAIRAIVGDWLNEGAIQWDVENGIANAKLESSVSDAAYRVLIGYRERMNAVFPKLLEAVPDAQQATNRFEINTGDDGVVRMQSVSGDKNQAAARELRGLIEQLASAHRDALLSLEPVLPPDQLAKIRMKCLTRVWPRTGMDPDSPAQVMQQLLARTTDPEVRTAIETARSAWMARWWNACMRMATAELSMPSTLFGFMNASPRDPSTEKARTDFDEASKERREIDRDAWKALAATDPSRRDFYEEQAKNASEKSGNRFMPRSLPSNDGEPSAVNVVSVRSSVSSSESNIGDAIDLSALEGATNAITSATFTISASDANDGVAAMIFTADSVGELGMPFGDAFGDGMGGGIEFSQADFNGNSLAGAGLALAQAASAERVRALAETLGISSDNAALTQMIDDYQIRCQALKDRYVEQLKSAVPGVAMAFEPSMQEATVDQLRAGIGIVDTHAALLATEDSALVDGLAALVSVNDALTQAVQAERARERIRSIRYPSMPGMDWHASSLVGLDLASCVRAAGLADANRVAALQAWAAWSPIALAVDEQLRTEKRSTAIEDLEVNRIQWNTTDVVAPQATDNAEGQSVSVNIGSGRGQELEQLRERRHQRQTEQAIAGRDAIEAALPSDARASFRDAWLRAVAPNAYRDTRDAMTTLDTARALPGVTDAQRTQIDALRGEQAARHRELCDRLALFVVTESLGTPASTGTSKKKEPRMSLTDTRFERSELNARSLRRVKSILTDEQVRAIPALAKTAAKSMKDSALGGNVESVSPAPTPAAPAPK